ncbi:permease [bacterium]|nr:permease [bacterium]
MKKLRTIIFIILSILGLFLFFPIPENSKFSFLNFCSTCPIYQEGIRSNVSLWVYLKNIIYGIILFSVTTIPVFATASFVSAIIKKKIYLHDPISAFFSASILPLCSCGAFPFIAHYKAKDQWENISKLVFLITTPILSPVIFILSLKMLGIWPTILRFVVSFIFAFLTAFLIYIFTKKKKEEAKYSNKKNTIFKPIVLPQVKNTTFLKTSEMYFYSLLKYVFYGIIIAAIVVLLVPKDYSKWFFAKDIFSTFLISWVGIPIHLCNGGDIIAVAPFVFSGMPVGLAIAFGITGTGICFTSIPLLYKILTKKGFIIFLISFLTLPAILALLTKWLFPIIPLVNRGF